MADSGESREMTLARTIVNAWLPQRVAAREGMDLATRIAAALHDVREMGQIEGSLAERERWSDFVKERADYQKMLKEFQARAEGAEAMLRLAAKSKEEG